MSKCLFSDSLFSPFPHSPAQHFFSSLVPRPPGVWAALGTVGSPSVQSNYTSLCSRINGETPVTLNSHKQTNLGDCVQRISFLQFCSCGFLSLEFPSSSIILTKYPPLRPDSQSTVSRKSTAGSFPLTPGLHVLSPLVSCDGWYRPPPRHSDVQENQAQWDALIVWQGLWLILFVYNQ